MNKKVLALVSSLALVSIGGLAIWSSFFSGISGLAVYSSSGGAISYTSNLKSNIIDVTNNPATVNDTIEVLDNDGYTNFIVGYDVNKTDIPDGCNDYLNDVNVTVSPTSFSLNNGQMQNVTVSYNVKRWSCPQNITVDLNITGNPS